MIMRGEIVGEILADGSRDTESASLIGPDWEGKGRSYYYRRLTDAGTERLRSSGVCTYIRYVGRAGRVRKESPA